MVVDKSMKLLKDKRGFSARDWIISILVFSVVIAIFSINVGDLSQTYEVGNITDEDFNASFNKFKETTAVTDEMWTQTTNKTGLSAVLGTTTFLFRATTAVIELTFNSIGIVKDTMKPFADYIGIPTELVFFFTVFVVTVFGIYLIFRILSSVTQREL
jgi:hypothetical protein